MKDENFKDCNFKLIEFVEGLYLSGKTTRTPLPEAPSKMLDSTPALTKPVKLPVSCISHMLLINPITVQFTEFDFKIRIFKFQIFNFLILNFLILNFEF